MARSYSLSVERSGQADAETAFDLLRDATTWKDWAGSPITFSGLARRGRTDDSVVGRVRLVGTHRFKRQSRSPMTNDRCCTGIGFSPTGPSRTTGHGS